MFCHSFNTYQQYYQLMNSKVDSNIATNILFPVLKASF